MPQDRPSPSSFISGVAQPPPTRPSPSAFVTGGGQTDMGNMAAAIRATTGAVGSDDEVINDVLRGSPEQANEFQHLAKNGYVLQRRSVGGRVIPQLVKGDAGSDLGIQLGNATGENRDNIQKLNEPAEEKALWLASTAAPIAAGVTGGLASRAGAGVVRRTLLTSLAGAAGEGANQTYQAVTNKPEAPQSAGDAAMRMAEQGGLQGLFEFLGSVPGKPAARVIGGSKSLYPAAGAGIDEIKQAELNRAVATLNERYNLGLSSADITQGKIATGLQKLGLSGVFGQGSVRKMQEAGANNATDYMEQILNGLSPSSNSADVGKTLLAGAERGSDIFHDAGSQTLSQIMAEAKRTGVNANMLPAQQAAMRDIKEWLGKSVKGNPATKMPPEMAAVFKSILATNGATDIPFGTAKGIQEGLGDMLKKPDLMAGKSQGVAKFYYGRMLDTMDNALAGNPALQKKFQDWRSFYAEGGQLFGESSLADLVRTARKAPEDVVGKIGPGEVTKVDNLKQALLGYNQFANPADRAANLSAWQSIQRQFAQQNLLEKDGVVDLLGMKDRLGKYGDDVLNKMYSTPKDQIVLGNMKDLAETMSRVKNLPGGASTATMKALALVLSGVMGLNHYGMGGAAEGLAAGYIAMPPMINKVLYSPYATKLLTRGISGIMQGSSTPMLQLGGEALQKASPYIETGMADVLRAFQIASSYPSQPDQATGTRKLSPAK